MNYFWTVYLLTIGVQNRVYGFCTICFSRMIVPLACPSDGMFFATATSLAMLHIMRCRDRWSGFTMAAPGHRRKNRRLSIGTGIFFRLFLDSHTDEDEEDLESRRTQLMHAMQQQTRLLVPASRSSSGSMPVMLACTNGVGQQQSDRSDERLCRSLCLCYESDDARIVDIIIDGHVLEKCDT